MSMHSINPNARLRQALRQWQCPACGGRKVYMNRGFKKDGKRVEGPVRVDGQFYNEEVPCTKCSGTGLHPIAYEALTRS